MRGFTERNLANLRLPLRPLATKKSERLDQIKETAESIAPLTHFQGNSTNMVDAQTKSDDAPPQASLTKLAEQHIANFPDHQLAKFVRTRQMQMHFATGRFWDENLGSWTMKCVGTQKINGRKHITLEHIAGDSEQLTRKFQRLKVLLTVSPLPREDRDVSLRAVLKINFPSAKTLTDLLPHCMFKFALPSTFGGETGDTVVVWLFIGTQKRLVALHSALIGSRRDGHTDHAV